MNETFANEKGCALLAAIDSGLLPRTADGYDTAKFEKFWALYVENMIRAHRSSTKQ